MKNIEVRREILANTKGRFDIGINGNAANHDAYNAAYDQYLEDGDTGKAMKTIADIFGKETALDPGGNKVSYDEYYEAWYEQKYRR